MLCNCNKRLYRDSGVSHIPASVYCATAPLARLEQQENAAAVKIVDYVMPQAACTAEARASSLCLEVVTKMLHQYPCMPSCRLASAGMALAAAGSIPLLAAWGSQDTSCQLLLSPSDVAPALHDSSAATAEQVGEYGLSATVATEQLFDHHSQKASRGGAVPGVQTCTTSTGQQQQQQGLKGLLDNGTGHHQTWQQSGWHMQQQHQQLQQQGDLHLLLWQQAQLQQLHPQQQFSGPQWHQTLSPPLYQPVPPVQQQQQLQPHNQQQQQQIGEQRQGTDCMQQSFKRCIPELDLSRVKVGSSQPVKNLADGDAVCEAVAEREAELCLDAGSIREQHLHPNAPLQDSRCYIYTAIGRKELSGLQDLLARLPARECREVCALWDALLVARHDCEVMAARGVRVSRDISSDWQETVSDLIDRVVAQDQEIAQLRQQLKSAQAAAQAAAASSRFGVVSANSVCGTEDLHTQVTRLRCQRDRLHRDQQELLTALAESQETAQLARQDAAEAKEGFEVMRLQAQQLRNEHTCLLSRKSELATAAECLEAQVEALEAAAAKCSRSTADQLLPDSLPADQLASNDYRVAYNSGGGIDQPGSDQTSAFNRPRSPAMAKASVQAAKASGRRSPFANNMQHVDCVDGRSSPVNSSTGRSRAKVPTLLLPYQPLAESSRQPSCPSSSPAASSHTVQASVAGMERCSQACVSGCKRLGPLIWGSGGGAAQTASSGGGTCGRSSLGLSSDEGSSAGVAQCKSSSAMPAAAATGFASDSTAAVVGGSQLRSSDDTLGASGASGSTQSNASKYVDQDDEQQVLLGPSQCLQTLAQGGGASKAPGPTAVVPAAPHCSSGACGTVHMQALGGAGIQSKLCFQHNTTASLLSAQGHQACHQEVELT